jgi:hypothetical protein
MALSYERVFSRAVCFYGKAAGVLCEDRFQGGEYGVEIGHAAQFTARMPASPCTMPDRNLLTFTASGDSPNFGRTLKE